MNSRELILLNPYRLPTQNPLILGKEDIAAFLNGYSALWHPNALRGASEPPRIASPYDYEQPTAGHIYAVPESPPLILPDDWDQRVRDAGAVAFRATTDRATTLANLQEALQNFKEAGATTSGQPETPIAPVDNALPAHDYVDLWNLKAERLKPFFAIGFGYIHVQALFEAMEHNNLLASGEFWQDIQQALAAAGDPDYETCRRHLQSAADRLLAAREVLYPASIYLVDIFLLDDHPNESLVAALALANPVNIVASASLLQQVAKNQPDLLGRIQERLIGELAEVCGGCFLEREDALLPIESQLWNLRKGLAASKALLGTDIRIFARKRFGFHPQTPLLLNAVGLQRALLLTFDESSIPTYRATVTNWPSPDGKQVEAFTRVPYAADDPQTYFHAAHYVHHSIMQDHAATVALIHKGTAAAPWYEDWLELSRFGPVLGQWTTLTRYFNEVMAGEQAGAASADEYHVDYLSERIDATIKHPVSSFARHVRNRRRIDISWSLAAIHRALGGNQVGTQLENQLAELEDKIEADPDQALSVTEMVDETARALADKLLARAQKESPGYVLLNPCSFARRVTLNLDAAGAPLPVKSAVKACQIDGDKMRLVVEVPALGFAWLPRSGPPGTPAMPMRMRLADATHVRNEFFEAEIDPTSGGLRGIYDNRLRNNRMGQQLVFNPGSSMRATEVKVTSTGPALGEIVTEGALVDDQQQVLATFRQRFRAWLGRPILELRMEIFPKQAPEGYPWHAYYGARFAWRDERALLLRGVNGTGYITSHTRPGSPDYLEIRHGRQNTVLFPGGLPFQQRHGARMLDLILVPPGEVGQGFDIGLSLDRDYPMQTALGMVSPISLVSVAKGPPHVGASGWLFHLDAPNMLLTSIRPVTDGTNAISARMLECGYSGGPVQFRCVRDPRRALLVDGRGECLMEATTSGDAVSFDVAQGDLVNLRIEFD